MAQYLIVRDNGTIVSVEAKNINAVARMNLGDEETAMIYRLVGPGKTVTARVEQTRRIEVSDAGEDQ